MYGKIFDSMYDGTLRGHWQAIVTLQQLIVLSDSEGVVDMTAEAIASRTTIPLAIIQAGIEHLMKPDPFTRTPGEDGRRIVFLDEHRPWGWRLVNHAKYRALRNMEEKREADRLRKAEERKKISDVASVSSDVRKVAHADADAETVEKTLSGEAPDGKGGAGKRREAREIAIRIVAYLNDAGFAEERITVSLWPFPQWFDTEAMDEMKALAAELRLRRFASSPQEGER